MGARTHTGEIRASQIQQLIEGEIDIYKGWLERVNASVSHIDLGYQPEDAIRSLASSAARLNHMTRLRDIYLQRVEEEA